MDTRTRKTSIRNCLLVLAVGTTLLAGSRTPAALISDDAAAAGNRFACDLYHELRDTDGNLFFSPSSISTALAMTYAGARGVTASEMAATLHLPDRQDEVHASYAELLADLAPDRS